MGQNPKFSVAMLLVSVIVLASYHSTKAQNAWFGVKGGLNVSNMYENNVDVGGQNARLGFHFGLYGQLPVTSCFAIQPELLYSTEGNKTKYNAGDTKSNKFNLNYLDMPVLAVFKLGGAVELHAGVHGGYLVGVNVKTDHTIDPGALYVKFGHDDFKKFDYGIVGGLGINFGNMQVGARYNHGLQKIAGSDVADWTLGDAKNSLAQVYFAVNFAGE